jgi:anti-sigma factor RsiW
MSCAEAARLIDPVLDDELDVVGLAAFDLHLEECRDCAAAFARGKAVRAARRARLPRHRAPSDLRQRLHQARPAAADQANTPDPRPPQPLAMPPGTARPIGPRPSAAGRVRMACSGLGGALAAALIAILLMHEAPGENAMIEAIVESHVGALTSGRLLDIASADPETIGPWLAGRLDVTPAVKNIADSGFELIGARLDYVAATRAAALVYRHREHILTLYVFSTPNAAASSSETVFRQGFAVCRWSRRGITRWAVSDMDPEELEQFEELVAG